MTTPAVIMHDQEPLQYDLYTPSKLEQFYQQKFPETSPFSQPDVRKFLSTLHLRGAVESRFCAYDHLLLCHSEKNSAELDCYENNGFVGVYYWSHALIALDWFRFASVDPGLTFDVDKINRDFLIYNRAWGGTREYRLKFAELLLDNNLVSTCRTSFSAVDQIHYTRHEFANHSFAISRQDLENSIPTNTAPSGASADYASSDYQQSGIEVVLETLFDDTRHHLTEKALRPIACGRAFILAATPGSLQYLRDYGFETFDGLIDETYDSIVDPLERLQAIIKEMQRISALPVLSKYDLWQQLDQIAARNQQKFFSQQWSQQVVQEFVDNLSTSIDRLGQHCTGQHWKDINAIIEQHPVLLEHQQQNYLPGQKTIEDVENFERWLSLKQSR